MSVDNLNVARVRTVKLPQRGTIGSAGIDFFIPDDVPTLTAKPGESFFIPSGIKANVPEGFALVAFNKSGIALKKGLQVGACVVDSDYQGEIHLHLINGSDKDVTVQGGDKLVQFLLLPVAHVPVNEVAETDLFNTSSVRGSGGFGSTGS
jgi:dUTP pyrophosphatase